MITANPADVKPELSPNAGLVLKSVKWATFQALMADVGEDRAWRIAYNQGVLEIRMPLRQHEEPTGLIESFLEALADELEIEISKLGALTLEREDLQRAVEPDSCFYIQNEAVIRGKPDINLTIDPPPDLVLESDFTNSSVNKNVIYSSMGVPELWRYKRDTLLVYHLIDGAYQLQDKSLAFPMLPVAEIPQFIEASKTQGQRGAVRLFRQRIRELLS